MYRLTLCVCAFLIGTPVTLDANAHPGHTSHLGSTPLGPEHPRPPKTRAELPTTSAAIFLDNLESQLETLQRQAALAPNSPGEQRKLAELMFSREQFRLDLAGQQRAIDILTHGISCDDQVADLFVSRAKMQQALHRFREAQADLARAIELGAAESAVRGVQQELDWNTGNYQLAIRAIREAAELSPSTRTLARLARLEHDLGNYSIADLRFEQAEDAYPDTNPLVLSWLNVQRGVCQVERANYRAAIEYFREAANRTPSSLLARSQLAEALQATGKRQEAIKIYESILAETTHPEFLGSLAAIYREQGETARADDLKRRASEGFRSLMRVFPEAMAGHASYFFLTEGDDPRLALKLTRQDVKLRPNSGAYLALARAQIANGHLEEASASLAVALKMPINSLGLTELRSTLRTLHPHAAN